MHVGANCCWIYEGHDHTPWTAAMFKRLALTGVYHEMYLTSTRR